MTGAPAHPPAPALQGQPLLGGSDLRRRRLLGGADDFQSSEAPSTFPISLGLLYPERAGDLAERGGVARVYVEIAWEDEKSCGRRRVGGAVYFYRHALLIIDIFRYYLP